MWEEGRCGKREGEGVVNRKVRVWCESREVTTLTSQITLHKADYRWPFYYSPMLQQPCPQTHLTQNSYCVI